MRRASVGLIVEPPDCAHEAKSSAKSLGVAVDSLCHLLHKVHQHQLRPSTSTGAFNECAYYVYGPAVKKIAPLLLLKGRRGRPKKSIDVFILPWFPKSRNRSAEL